MKPGEKYIIEIESVSKMPKGDIAFIKGFNALVFDQYGLNHLENLYSTDRLKAEAKMRGDEYRRGFDDGTANQKIKDTKEIAVAYNRGLVEGIACTPATKPEVDVAYQSGLDDAWCMIRTMYSEMTIGDLRRIFNMQDVDAANIVMAILKTFDPAEVKRRLDACEKEKEKKEKEKQVPVNAYISLGDEVKFNPDNVTIIVTRLGYNFITGIDKHGSVYTYGLPCNWEKTGRHFDLSELFKFMGRKDDGPEL